MYARIMYKYEEKEVAKFGKKKKNNYNCTHIY